MVSVSATVREDSGTITAGHREGNFHSNYIIQLSGHLLLTLLMLLPTQILSNVMLLHQSEMAQEEIFICSMEF